MAKVLIVEDDQILRDMYTQKLQNHGYEVYGAADGEEGLAQIRSLRPDLVLLDLMMPKKTGFQVVDEVRADSQINSTPIIILTNVFADVKDLIDDGGVKDYILKSDHAPAEVLNRVNKILNPNGVPQPPVSTEGSFTDFQNKN